MGVLSQFLISQLVDEHHPALDTDACILKKQRRVPCSACIDICPREVFSDGRIMETNWAACNSCNLCVSACRARCLTASTDTLRPYLTGYDGSGSVKIGCENDERRVKLRESCVAAIPWEFLAYLGLKMQVQLYLPCRDCTKEDAKELLEENLLHLREFFGPTEFARQFLLVRDDEEDAEDPRASQSVTRAELLSMMTRTVSTTAVSSMANVHVEDYNGLFYRRMLGELTKRLSDESREVGEKTAFGIRLPHFTSRCYTCDDCSRLCPSKAISFGEIKDGRRGIYLDIWKCTACGVCKGICPEKAIDEIRLMQVPHLQRLLITRMNVRVCSQCKKPMRHMEKQEVCATCRAKNRVQARKEKKAQEEAEKQRLTDAEAELE